MHNQRRRRLGRRGRQYWSMHCLGKVNEGKWGEDRTHEHQKEENKTEERSEMCRVRLLLQLLLEEEVWEREREGRGSRRRERVQRSRTQGGSWRRGWAKGARGARGARGTTEEERRKRRRRRRRRRFSRKEGKQKNTLKKGQMGWNCGGYYCLSHRWLPVSSPPPACHRIYYPGPPPPRLLRHRLHPSSPSASWMWACLRGQTARLTHGDPLLRGGGWEEEESKQATRESERAREQWPPPGTLPWCFSLSLSLGWWRCWW